MKTLLDTCAFLWLTTDAPEPGEKTKRCFKDPDNAIYLSSVSVWEMLGNINWESCRFRASRGFYQATM